MGGAVAVAAALMVAPAAQAEPIRGAGSTFAAPIIGKWATAYEIARADGGDFFTPDWTVDYELVGSLAGLMRLDQPEMDFAATDVPVTPADLEETASQQFPIVMGGIAVVVNLDGIGRRAAFACPARCWPISISARSSPGPIRRSRRSIPTSRFLISRSRSSPPGWLRLDLRVHGVSVGGQRGMEDQARRRHADLMAARRWCGRHAEPDSRRAWHQRRDRLCRIRPGPARRPFLRADREQGRQIRQAGPGGRAGRRDV